MSRMSRMLISGVVIIIATSSASHATDQLLEHVLGRWCFDYNISTKSEQVYFRPDRTTPDRCCCSDMTDGVTVTQEGYSDDAPRDDPGGCLFDKIEQKDRDTYLIKTRCKEKESDPYYPSEAEFQIINGLLFIKWGPQHSQRTTPALSQERPNVRQFNEVVKACVEAVNAGGGVGQSDAYYNPALHGVQIGVATPMWTFKFNKCMAERGFFSTGSKDAAQ